jgi:hypothetical protein
MTMRLLASITVLLAGWSSAASQPPQQCLRTSTVTDAKLMLTIPGGHTSFNEGEIIPLTLSFTASGDKHYRVASATRDRSGRLNIDTYCLEPEAHDPLADYFSTTFSLSGGAWGLPELGDKPVVVSLELNEWRQPGPGHYRLYVVSPRVSEEPSTLASQRAGGSQVILRSNTIEFEVIKADAETRTRQLQQATETYEHPAAVPCDFRVPNECAVAQAARRLRFMSTKESADALARLFWSFNDQPGGWDLMFGLFGSPYRTDVIAAMGREINSPDHPITEDFLQTFTKLQLLQVVREVPRLPPTDDPIAFRNWNESLQSMMAHEPEVKKAAVASTVAAVPRKTGRARALTVLTLASESSSLLDKATAAQMRRELAARWGDLPEKTKRDLLQGNWAHRGNEMGPLGGPEALPILLQFVSQPAAQFTNDVTSRNAALKRIFELDPAQGRSLIFRDLNDPQAQPSISLVKLLSSDELRPAVQQAVQRVATAQERTSPFESSGARPLDYSLVEVFADKSALGSLERNFKVSYEGPFKGSCVGYVEPMLRYFLRVDPRVGTREVQATLDARKATGCYKRLFEDLGRSLPTVEPLAISDLDDADLEVSMSAARALGRWGSAKAEPALWTRLRRFHEEWPNGVGEVTLTDAHTTARVGELNSLESTLVQSIVTGTNWMCGPEKLALLRQLVSREQRMQLSHLIDEWEGQDGPFIIMPDYRGVDDRLTFGVLQLNYTGLDEQQIRTKLSQMPHGSRLYFQTYTSEQMGSPVSMEEQHAVLQGLRKDAAQFGVTVVERPH